MWYTIIIGKGDDLCYAYTYCDNQSEAELASEDELLIGNYSGCTVKSVKLSTCKEIAAIQALQ